MKSELTIAIITKKRPSKLARCIESICKQSVLPDHILIIDNDSSKSAYPVFKKYAKTLPIIYSVLKKGSVPSARNKAVSSSRTKYLGFVDDDCLLDSKWVEEGLNMIKGSKKLAYVCGKTLLYNKESIVALSQYLRDTYWYSKKIRGTNQTTAENFDTKNIILNRKLIVNLKLKFDFKCGMHGFDSADFDFGLQLSHKFLNGIYCKEMQLFHEETSSLNRYIKRGYYRGNIAGYINKKWKFDYKLVDPTEKNIFRWVIRTIRKMPTNMKRYTQALKVPIYYKILTVILINAYERVYLDGFLDFKS